MTKQAKKIIEENYTQDTLSMYLKVGNDNGNSEQDIVINEEIVKQPNVYSRIRKLPNLDSLDPMGIANDIHNNLAVTIESPKVNGGRPSIYYIGNQALKSGAQVTSINIGSVTEKQDLDLPIINTLAELAGYACAKAYIADQGVKHVEITADMVTALPVNYHNKDTARKMAFNFLGETHKITVHLGSHNVDCTIKFDGVAVLPESIPTITYLIRNPHRELLEEFKRQYALSDEDLYFNDVRMLHVGIGDGTTEYPMTIDEVYSPDFLHGSSNGVGQAIEAVIQDFRQEHNLPKFSRQEYSEALKDKNHRYHKEAMDFIEIELENQSNMIFDEIVKQVENARNNLDYICVYGGGSILLRPYLEPMLLQLGANARIKILYIPKDYCVDVEAWGMYEYVDSELFDKYKITV